MGTFSKVQEYLGQLPLSNKDKLTIGGYLNDIERTKSEFSEKKLDKSYLKQNLNDINLKIRDVLDRSQTDNKSYEYKENRLTKEQQTTRKDIYEPEISDSQQREREEYDVLLRRFEDVLNSFVYDVELDVNMDNIDDYNESKYTGIINKSEVSNVAHECLKSLKNVDVSAIVLQCIEEGDQKEVFAFLKELKQLRCFVDVMKRRTLFEKVKLGEINNFKDAQKEFERIYDLNIPFEKNCDDKQILQYVLERFSHLTSITDVSQASLKVIDEMCVLIEGMSILNYPV